MEVYFTDEVETCLIYKCNAQLATLSLERGRSISCLEAAQRLSLGGTNVVFIKKQITTLGREM